MTEDRTYVRTTGAWHAFVSWTRVPGTIRVLCGRDLHEVAGEQRADRIPSSGHFCGNCSRLVAAHTDIER